MKQLFLFYDPTAFQSNYILNKARQLVIYRFLVVWQSMIYWFIFKMNCSEVVFFSFYVKIYWDRNVDPSFLISKNHLYLIGNVYASNNKKLLDNSSFRENQSINKLIRGLFLIYRWIHDTAVSFHNHFSYWMSKPCFNYNTELL